MGGTGNIFPLVIGLTLILGLGLLRGLEGSPMPQGLGAALAGKPVTVLKDDREYVDGNGNWKFDIEQSDGQKQFQVGMTEPPEKEGDEGSLVMKGGYEYVAPDGSTIKVTYIADKGGFRQMSKRIPKSS